MASLTPVPKIQFFDANGNPLVGGKLYTYAAGTSTPLATYVDQVQSATNTNPVILDGRGEASVWLSSLGYKFKLTDANDVEIWTIDNITASASGGGGGSASLTRQRFSGDGTTDQFTLSTVPDASGSTVQVFINGVYQQSNTYSISGIVITFSEAPPIGTDNVEILQFSVAALGSTSAYLVSYSPPAGTAVTATNVQDALDDIAASSGSSLVGYLPAGTGAVTRTAQAKMRETVSVKDFGAVGDGVADDTAAIQAAIDYCQTNNRTLEFCTGDKHKITSTLTWKHGQSSSDSIKYNVRVIGNNAQIFPSSTATAIDIVPRCLLADIATGRGDADIDISDLWIDGFHSPATAKAINIGRAGYYCSNFEWSKVEGITVASFSAGNTVVQLIECRHINFTTMSVRQGSVSITTNTSNAFCGDLVFNTCEFTGTASSRPINISSAASAGQVRGITFSACDIYGTGTLISSTGALSLVGDIWFENGCQFDGPGSPAGEIALTLNGSSTGKLFQIHVIQAYFVSYTGAVIYGVTAGGSVISQLNIQGGGINNITCSGGSGNAAMFFLNCESLSVRDVEFDSISATAGQLINIDGCTNVLVHNNKATNSSGIDYGITIGNASNNYSICNNVVDVATAVINDYSSGTPTKQSANNLQI